jgi:hypothetical protein
VRRLLALDSALPDDVPPGAEVAAGTSGNFAELNRSRPEAAWADTVCFPMSPSVHASDRLTMLENLPAQASAIESARRIAGSKGIAITPVVLDARQRGTWFAAAWVLGSVKYLAESGVASVTYDYPHEILAAVADATHVVPCRSSDPLLVEALAVNGPTGPRVFLANFSAVERRVDLGGRIVSVAAHTVGAFD